MAGPQSDPDSIMFDIPIVGLIWSVFNASGGDRLEEGNYSYYAVNDQEIELKKYPKQIIDINGKEVTVWSPVGIYNEEQVRDEEFSSNVLKQESPGKGIINTSTSELKDTLNTTLHVRFDNAETDATESHSSVLPEYIYEGEMYEDEDMGKKTVKAVDNQISLGAYARDDINRIDYSKDKVGTKIYRERSWETANE
jgi:hypothetical protein